MDEQLVTGKVRWRGWSLGNPSFETPMKCGFLLQPPDNCGDLDYSAFPEEAGFKAVFVREHHGEYVFGPSIARARFNLNGADGFKTDGSEIYEAKWNPDDGKWYMSLPRTAMPLVRCTLYYADPISGLKKGLLLPSNYGVAHAWVPPYGMLFRPFDDNGDVDRFIYWWMDGEEGWKYGGTFRWQIEFDPLKFFDTRTNVLIDDEGARIWRSQKTEIDTGIHRTTFEIFTFGEDGTLTRSIETVEPLAAILLTTSGGCGGDDGVYSIASQTAPTFKRGGRYWKPVTLRRGGESRSGHIRDDGAVLVGTPADVAITAASSYPPQEGGLAERYEYLLAAPYSYAVDCGLGFDPRYRTVTNTPNTLEKQQTVQQVDLKTYLKSPSTDWYGMHTGSTWDSWLSPKDYWILRACYREGGVPRFQDHYLCVRKSDFEIFEIDWSDYEEDYPNMQPDTLRVYGGIPYLHCYKFTEYPYYTFTPFLINMLTGEVIKPRDNNWLWNSLSLPKTTYDGVFGYDGHFFYEEPEYTEYFTFHGDTALAFMKDVIHVAGCEVEEILDCQEGFHRAKATFTIRDLNTQDPVVGVDVTVRMMTYRDGQAFGVGITELETTDENGNVTFEYPTCVFRGDAEIFEIKFLVLDVHSIDVREYEPSTNFCTEAVFTVGESGPSHDCCNATFNPDPAQFQSFYPFQGQAGGKWHHIMVAVVPSVDPFVCSEHLEYRFECQDDPGLNSPWRGGGVSGTFPDGRSQIGRPHEYWAEVPSGSTPYSGYKWQVKYRMKGCQNESEPSSWTPIQNP